MLCPKPRRLDALCQSGPHFPPSKGGRPAGTTRGLPRLARTESPATRSWVARLAELILVAAACWAMVGVSGQTKPVEAVRAPAFGWQLPDWMAPPLVPADNPMSAAKVELGRYLFFDARLAGLNYISCSTCHRPELGFTDGRPVAIGVTGERHPRNSQPLANVGYLPALTWADPAVTSLEEQSKLPLFGDHPVEMLAAGREPAIIARLEVDRRYLQLFAAAFPETGGRVDFVALRKALAAVERALLSFGAPYDPGGPAGGSISSPFARPWQRSSGRCCRSMRPTTGGGTRAERMRSAPRRSGARACSAASGCGAASAIRRRSSPMPSAHRITTIPASAIWTAPVPCRPATKAGSSTPGTPRTWAGSARRACAMSP